MEGTAKYKVFIHSVNVDLCLLHSRDWAGTGDAGVTKFCGAPGLELSVAERHKQSQQ